MPTKRNNKPGRPPARIREQQMRRRLAAQGLDLEPALAGAMPDEAALALQAQPATLARPWTAPASEATIARSLSASRAVTATPTPAYVGRIARKMREPQSEALSIEQEMVYIRGDIKKMVLLSLGAFLILALLSFVLS